MTIKTPIIFTVEPFVEQEEDPVIPQPDPPITSENELDLITEPIFLAPRYYLKIKAPENVKNDAFYIPNEFKYYIPWEGIYKNQVRLPLAPTIGWGEGSCYTVEYWEWTPQIRPLLYRKRAVNHKHIKTEYWLVPHPSNRYLVNYQYIDKYRFNTLKIALTSTGSPISLANYNDILVVTSINKTTNFSINPVIETNTSLIQRAVNYKKTTDLLLTTDIPVDEVFTINYIKPVDIRNILFKNSLFPQNIYINNSSFLQNQPVTF